MDLQSCHIDWAGEGNGNYVLESLRFRHDGSQLICDKFSDPDFVRPSK